MNDSQKLPSKLELMYIKKEIIEGELDYLPSLYLPLPEGQIRHNNLMKRWVECVEAIMTESLINE